MFLLPALLLELPRLQSNPRVLSHATCAADETVKQCRCLVIRERKWRTRPFQFSTTFSSPFSSPCLFHSSPVAQTPLLPPFGTPMGGREGGGRGEPFATSWDEKGRKGGGGEKGGGGVIYYTKTHAAPSRRLQGDPFPAAILAPRVGRRGEGGGFHVRVGVGLRPNEREEKRRGRKGAFKKVDSRGGGRGRRGCSRARSFRLSLPPLFSPPPGKGKSIP